MRHTDILIIGSGGAGARAAIEAARHGLDVLMVTKGRMARSGATITSRADMSVDGRSIKNVLGLAGDTADSPEIYLEDTLVEGKYINDQEMAEALVEEAPWRVRELIDWGMKVYDVVRAAGHRFPRGVISPGKEIMRALGNEIARHPNIRLQEDTMVLDLLKTDRCVSGAVGWNLRTGGFDIFSARAVVLTTGGAQVVYPMHTGPEELSGDGQAMAWRAGAELINMEMAQFLPAAFLEPLAWRGISFPFSISMNQHAMRGWLLNRRGERFMESWDSARMENSTRDVLSVAVMHEILEGRGSPAGGVFLSFAHLPKNLIDYFATWHGKPNLQDDWTYNGFKFNELMEKVKDGYAMEVAPACHFFMGGIRVDPSGRTCVDGLYAAGEVSGGLHGANRLSGNAIPQILVQGKRAGEAAAQFVSGSNRSALDPSQAEAFVANYRAPIKGTGGVSPYRIKQEIQDLAWLKVGVIRGEQGLREALGKIERIEKEDLPRLHCSSKDLVYNRELMECFQVRNLLLVLKAIAQSALARRESRGAHHRSDYNQRDNSKWLKNIVLRNTGDQVEVLTVPIRTTRHSLPLEEK